MGEFSAATIITYIYGAVMGLIGASLGADDTILRAASRRPRR
jgi:hypothetical protein